MNARVVCVDQNVDITMANIATAFQQTAASAQSFGSITSLLTGKAFGSGGILGAQRAATELAGALAEEGVSDLSANGFATLLERIKTRRSANALTEVRCCIAICLWRVLS